MASLYPRAVQPDAGSVGFTVERLEKYERSCYFQNMSRGEQTRQAILNEAMTAASTLGLTGLSIGGLARATGMSKSGLFAHFQSKEALQVQLLDYAAERLVNGILAPALETPRGEPRIRALFEGWLTWLAFDRLPGGCPFIAAATELDDREGPVRDALVKHEKHQIAFLRRAGELAVEEGHFRADLDLDQFAYELFSLFLGHHFFTRLIRLENAANRARTAFESLLDRSRAH